MCVSKTGAHHRNVILFKLNQLFDLIGFSVEDTRFMWAFVHTDFVICQA